MKEVRLSNGMIATVDDDDYDKVKDIAWFYSQYGYTRGRIETCGKRVWVLMHRYILGTERGDDIIVDHKTTINCVMKDGILDHVQ